MKTAIVYDRVNKWGGAERVLLALHEIFPDAPLYTSVYSPEKASWARVFPQVVASSLNRMSLLQDKHQLLAPLMPIMFESFNFDEYDLVISVTSESAKGIITKPGTLHICYCLTPTRYLWSGYREYFKGEVFKSLTKPVVTHLRKWDKIAAQRPDIMIAISEEVKNRIKKYYCKDSEVIYPPVDVDRFKIQNTKYKLDIKKNNTKSINNLISSGYYLIVSRLEPYKKVDLAIRAFNKLGIPLVIIGTGSEEDKLRSIARSNIIFKGFVDDEDLPSNFQNAKAFIFPQEEDFGIAAVEAQAAGCLVIAFKKGGALETVVEGKTGLFFEKQSIESLVDVIKKFESMEFDKELLEVNAKRFNKQRFQKEILDLVKINV